jgi:hypothetical protein
MAKNQNYTDVILEEINDKFDLIMETVVPMRHGLSELKQQSSSMQDDIHTMKGDTKIIKIEISRNNKLLNDHETRITHLETKLA